MNKIDSLISVVKEFVSRPKKERALLIDGQEGSGKTFFVQNRLGKEIFPCMKLKKIYVSLKGITSLKEITDNVIKQIIFKNRKYRGISEFVPFVSFLIILTFMFLGKYAGIFRDFVNTFGVLLSIVFSILIYIDSETKKVFPDIFFGYRDFSKYVFIFDDLERLPEKFSYSDVLFYIHSLLLESKNASVIFIADTSKLFINDKRKLEEEKYNNAEEKVIGRKIVFEQSMEDIFGNYVDCRYDNLDAKCRNFIKTNKKINEIIEKCGVKNFRSYNSFF